jgi:hypothetical protein
MDATAMGQASPNGPGPSIAPKVENSWQSRQGRSAAKVRAKIAADTRSGQDKKIRGAVALN